MMLVVARCDLTPPFSASKASHTKESIVGRVCHLPCPPTLIQNIWVTARGGTAGSPVVR